MTQPTLPGMDAFIPPPPPSSEPRRFDDCSAREVAFLFDVTVQAIDSWIRTGCPAPKDSGHRVFDLKQVIAWRRARDEANARPRTPDGEDPLMLAGSSPALERYRMAKAKMAEFDLQQKRGHLVEKHAITTQFRAAAATLRAAFETLERRHGREVGDSLRDVLDDVIRNLKIED